jgi:anti-sigma regulatory factor (Ser/Thr protein kinase)
MPHHLQFYEDDATLIGRVADFARDGLSADDLVILVATADHLEAIEAHLAASGFNAAKARAVGRLQTADASEMLALFADGGQLDQARFEASVGEIVREAVATQRPVRIFGEMVAVLWDAGHVAAAVELEEFWEELGRHEDFDLLCAYPTDVLLGANCNHVNLVCELHGDIALTAKESSPTRLRAYPALLSAVRAARHFVLDCVDDDTSATRAAVEDALLITSELSANAVYHAKTSFVVELSWHDDVIRIGVRDSYHGRPRMRAAHAHSGSGRGIAMVDSLSARWGVEPHARGKTVWAELPI